MVGDDHRGGTFIDCRSSVISGENAFDGDSGQARDCGSISVIPGTAALASAALTSTKFHRSFARMRRSQLTDRVAQELAIQPGRARICEGMNLVQQASAHQFFHAIAEVALAQSSNGRVDGDHQSGATPTRARSITARTRRDAHQNRAESRPDRKSSFDVSTRWRDGERM